MYNAEDNFIAKELDENDLEVIQGFRDNGKLHPDWLPFVTYDLVQMGYPYADHGGMVARDYGGTDEEHRLLPSTGMWCKVEDVLKLLESMKPAYQIGLTHLQNK
jgi:hypothetical protein